MSLLCCEDTKIDYEHILFNIYSSDFHGNWLVPDYKGGTWQNRLLREIRMQTVLHLNLLQSVPKNVPSHLAGVAPGHRRGPWLLERLETLPRGALGRGHGLRLQKRPQCWALNTSVSFQHLQNPFVSHLVSETVPWVTCRFIPLRLKAQQGEAGAVLTSE